MLTLNRETPVGYALLKAKSSKILKKDGFAAEDESADNICSLYVHTMSQPRIGNTLPPNSSLREADFAPLTAQAQPEGLSQVR